MPFILLIQGFLILVITGNHIKPDYNSAIPYNDSIACLQCTCREDLQQVNILDRNLNLWFKKL